MKVCAVLILGFSCLMSFNVQFSFNLELCCREEEEEDGLFEDGDEITPEQKQEVFVHMMHEQGSKL